MRTRAAVLALLIGIGPLACAETTRVETSSRTTTSPQVSSPGVESGTPIVVQEKTVSKTTTDPDSCNGVISCTVDFAGTVIAFPFRLVGSLFGAIF